MSAPLNPVTCAEAAIPENREIQKWKLSFFRQRHTLSTSFDIFVITYRVTNFLPKLVHMLLFSAEKNWISIFGFPLFLGYACRNSHNIAHFFTFAWTSIRDFSFCCFLFLDLHLLYVYISATYVTDLFTGLWKLTKNPLEKSVRKIFLVDNEILTPTYRLQTAQLLLHTVKSSFYRLHRATFH